VLSLCAVNEMMLGRRSVFENWAGNCSVEIEKLLIWNSHSSVLRFFGMYPAMGVALYRRGVMDNLAR